MNKRQVADIITHASSVRGDKDFLPHPLRFGECTIAMSGAYASIHAWADGCEILPIWKFRLAWRDKEDGEKDAFAPEAFEAGTEYARDAIVKAFEDQAARLEAQKAEETAANAAVISSSHERYAKLLGGK